MTVKVYEVGPKYKKSLNEYTVFRSESLGVTVRTECLWRGGTFVVAMNDEEYEEAKTTDYFDLDDYPHDLLETWDSCYEGYEILTEVDEEREEELNEMFEEGMEEDGLFWFVDNEDFLEGDVFWTIECELDIKEADTENYGYLIEDHYDTVEDEEPVEV